MMRSKSLRTSEEIEIVWNLNDLGFVIKQT